MGFKTEAALLDVQKLIVEECDAVKDLLLQKNREYGNSALEPINIFCQLPALAQIDVRIDDKLSRIKTTQNLPQVSIKEDTVLDLIGYLVLRRVAIKRGIGHERDRTEAERDMRDGNGGVYVPPSAPGRDV